MADTQGRHGAQHWQQLPESGLEVVPSSNDYPEVYSPSNANDLYVNQPVAEDQHKYSIPSTDANGYHPAYAAYDAGYSPAPEKTPDGHAYPISTPGGAEPASPRRSRKKKIIALILIAVLIIVGAVVGGVVGSQAARSKGGDGGASPR